MATHEQWLFHRLHKIERELMTTHLGLFELVTLSITSIVLSQQIDGGFSGFGIVYCLFVIVGTMAVGTISDAIVLIYLYKRVHPVKWMSNSRSWIVTLIGTIFPQFGVSVLLFLGLLLLLSELTGGIEISISVPIGLSVFVGICALASVLSLLRVKYVSL